MAIAGYLKDAKNQQKKLAENLTAKGVTASATEKYDSLVSKVAQIEKLRGEERVLNNITQYNDTPESMVQLEYPENVEKSIDLQLSSKNLFDKNNANILFAFFSSITPLTVSASTRTIWIPCLPNNTYTVSKIQNARFAVGFTSEEPATGVTVHRNITDNTTTKITNTSGENDKYIVVYLYHSSFDTTVTFDEILATLQIELGSTATPYTPYISDFSTVNVTACGKNLFDLNSVELTKNVELIPSGIKTTGVADIDIKLPAGQYTLSFKRSIPGGIVIRNGKVAQGYIALTSAEATSVTFNYTASVDGYLRISTFQTNLELTNIQLERDSTATPYEPYQGQTYTPTSDGKVTDISSIYPITNIFTDNAGALITVYQGTPGNSFIEVLPSEGKNGITKIQQPIVDSSVDFNIKPENIKKDISILGTVGTLDPAPATTVVEPDFTYDSNSATIYLVMK